MYMSKMEVEIDVMEKSPFITRAYHIKKKIKLSYIKKWKGYIM